MATPSLCCPWAQDRIPAMHLLWTALRAHLLCEGGWSGAGGETGGITELPHAGAKYMPGTRWVPHRELSTLIPTPSFASGITHA